MGECYQCYDLKRASKGRILYCPMCQDYLDKLRDKSMTHGQKQILKDIGRAQCHATIRVPYVNKRHKFRILKPEEQIKLAQLFPKEHRV